jgi:hypothetical protein
VLSTYATSGATRQITGALVVSFVRKLLVGNARPPIDHALLDSAAIRASRSVSLSTKPIQSAPAKTPHPHLARSASAPSPIHVVGARAEIATRPARAPPLPVGVPDAASNAGYPLSSFRTVAFSCVSVFGVERKCCDCRVNSTGINSA